MYVFLVKCIWVELMLLLITTSVKVEMLFIRYYNHDNIKEPINHYSYGESSFLFQVNHR